MDQDAAKEEEPAEKLTFVRMHTRDDAPKLTFVRVPSEQQEREQNQLTFVHLEPLKKRRQHRLSPEQLTAQRAQARAQKTLRGGSVAPVLSSFFSSFNDEVYFGPQLVVVSNVQRCAEPV
jgi:hypothetical protein